MTSLKQQFLDFLSDGNLEEALKTINTAAPQLSNEVILHQARLSALNQNVRLGIISHSDAQLNQNQILQAIIDIGGKAFKEPLDLSPKNDSQTLSLPDNEEMEKIKREAKIYFSYSWGDDKSESGKKREKYVDELFIQLKEDGYNVIRDKTHVGYGDSIETFMRDLGRNGLNLVFLSDKYFKSFYSMFELMEIARNNLMEKKLFQNAILPVHVENISFLDDLGKMRTYLEYWRLRFDEISALWDDYKDDLGTEFQGRYSKIKSIKSSFVKLYSWLGDINASSVALLSEDDYEIVKRVINQRLTEKFKSD